MRDLIAKKADIFIENFPPAKMSKLGLDYNSVRDLNRSLVYASVTGFPQYSDWADKEDRRSTSGGVALRGSICIRMDFLSFVPGLSLLTTA